MSSSNKNKISEDINVSKYINSFLNGTEKHSDLIDSSQRNTLEYIYLKELQKKGKENVKAYYVENFGSFIYEINSNRILCHVHKGKIFTGEDLKVNLNDGTVENADNKLLEEAENKVKESIMKKNNNNIKTIDNSMLEFEQLSKLTEKIKNSKMDTKRKKQFMNEITKLQEEKLSKIGHCIKSNFIINTKNFNLSEQESFCKKNIAIISEIEQFEKRNQYKFKIDHVDVPYINKAYNVRLNNMFFKTNTDDKNQAYYKVNDKSQKAKITTEMYNHFIGHKNPTQPKQHFEYIVAKNFIEGILEDPKSGACSVESTGFKNKDFFVKNEQGNIIAYVDNKGDCYKSSDVKGEGIKLKYNTIGENEIANAVKVNLGTREEIALKMKKKLEMKDKICEKAKEIINKKTINKEPLTYVERILLNQYFVNSKENFEILNKGDNLPYDLNLKTGQMERSAIANNILNEIEERQKKWKNQLNDINKEIERINTKKKQQENTKSVSTVDKSSKIETVENNNNTLNKMLNDSSFVDKKQNKSLNKINVEKIDPISNNVLDDSSFIDASFQAELEGANIKPDQKKVEKQKNKSLIYDIKEQDILNKTAPIIGINNKSKKSSLNFDI